MLQYNDAKKLVSYFTNVCDLTVFVRVEYETNPEIGKNEMPKMPEVCLIEIDYYEKDAEGKADEMIATLEIDALFDDYVNDDNVVCGKRVGFDLSTRATENNGYDEEQCRANLVKEIAERIAQAMQWEWYV
jgi:hypothetical protein